MSGRMADRVIWRAAEIRVRVTCTISKNGKRWEVEACTGTAGYEERCHKPISQEEVRIHGLFHGCGAQCNIKQWR
ncbi:hypothetical protein E2C01_036489 [Portunus trituberculatus]|uniref:Uncharacterized protein n=1 Tax=Portunus trituberculatus TaxID=210409 RepID=A0A5B7FCL7_PORTR|nr:hypothetical protein [Portunus trituberculatus]